MRNAITAIDVARDDTVFFRYHNRGALGTAVTLCFFQRRTAVRRGGNFGDALGSVVIVFNGAYRQFSLACPLRGGERQVIGLVGVRFPGGYHGIGTTYRAGAFGELSRDIDICIANVIVGKGIHHGARIVV